MFGQSRKSIDTPPRSGANEKIYLPVFRAGKVENISGWGECIAGAYHAYKLLLARAVRIRVRLKNRENGRNE